ncbi:MAG TPA: imelysin family protein [Vicinamibacterales bacterium]|nr:imelysin family protein [Vicinamibacterales bacterium]
MKLEPNIRNTGPRTLSGAAVCALLAVGCGNSSGASDPTPPVVRQYAVNLDASYKDAVTQIEALNTAVQAFVAAPSPEGLSGCQAAWLAAHRSYGEGEYSRFYGGPIDQAQGGMNEWPIDESFIDYTQQSPSGGIINDPNGYPQINEQILATSDQRGGTENLSTGFHAIEFLLWGERPDPSQGPGMRPYTDFVDGGTAANQDRRRTYLGAVTSELLGDMSTMASQWDLGEKTSYASKLLANPHDALTKFFRGISQMAISELLYERLDDPYISQDKKDEASCFSESTYDDLVANSLGIEDAYTGHYQTLSGSVLQGPSISELVKAKAPAVDAQLRQELAAVRAAIGAIPPPFDHAVLSPPMSAERMAVVAAVDALQPMQHLLDQAGQALGIVNNL